MLIGYARVSTVGQDYEAQKEALEKAGCEKIFVEKVSGRSTKDRKELENAIGHLRAGDTLVVTKIDRLARSIIDLNNVVTRIMKAGANVHFISENMNFKNGEGMDSLQTLMFNMLGSFAQFERDLIVQRTSEGRERARQQGKHLGRPSQPEKEIERALQLYAGRVESGHSVNDIVKLTGVPRSTLYAEIRKRKENIK